MGHAVCLGNDKTACHGADCKDIVVISWSRSSLVRGGKVNSCPSGGQSVTVGSSAKSLPQLQEVEYLNRRSGRMSLRFMNLSTKSP
jgi:hypothetical protein